MAENNEYHIYVHFIGGEDVKSAVAGESSGSTGVDKISSVGASGSSAGANKVANKIKSLVSFAAVKSTADQIINYRINQVSLRTGATEYEQRLSYTYNAVSQTVGAGAALIGAGIIGGPAGVAVAAIGIAVNGVKKFIDIEQKSETLQLQQQLENISIGMARVRAGTTGRRSKEQ